MRRRTKIRSLKCTAGALHLAVGVRCTALRLQALSCGACRANRRGGPGIALLSCGGQPQHPASLRPARPRSGGWRVRAALHSCTCLEVAALHVSTPWPGRAGQSLLACCSPHMRRSAPLRTCRTRPPGPPTRATAPFLSPPSPLQHPPSPSVCSHPPLPAPNCTNPCMPRSALVDRHARGDAARHPLHAQGLHRVSHGGGMHHAWGMSRTRACMGILHPTITTMLLLLRR